jgi:hypothetical protein
MSGRQACFTTLAYSQPGNYHQDFLLHDLPKLLDYEPVEVRARMWYIHDGTLARCSHTVQDVTKKHHDQRIGIGGPPCSQDLNPPHFYLSEHLKTLVYAAPVDNKETFHCHIREACKALCNYFDIFEQMQQSMKRHVRACTESHGGYSEHLQMFLSAITTKLNVSQHIFMHVFYFGM